METGKCLRILKEKKMFGNPIELNAAACTYTNGEAVGPCAYEIHFCTCIVRRRTEYATAKLPAAATAIKEVELFFSSLVCVFSLSVCAYLFTERISTFIYVLLHRLAQCIRFRHVCVCLCVRLLVHYFRFGFDFHNVVLMVLLIHILCRCRCCCARRRRFFFVRGFIGLSPFYLHFLAFQRFQRRHKTILYIEVYTQI